MASRMKEDEKNEMIIRGLLMLHANRRCINCNCLFPSMASYQGSVQNMTALRNLLCSCSFGTPSPRQIPSQQPS